MRAAMPWWSAGVLALAGCQSLDPGPDAQAMRDDVATRAAAAVPAPTAAFTSELPADVVALLRAPLDDAGLVRVAMLNNHRVQALAAKLGVARADLVQAARVRNPVLDADARFLFDGGTDLELGLMQPLFDLFWQPLRAAAGAHRYAAAKALLTDDLLQLVFAVRRAAVDARAAARLVALHRDDVVAAGAAHDLQLTLHAAGNVTAEAVALARAGESRARLDLAAAELAAVEAREALQRLLGLWGAATEWTLAGELADDALAGVDLAHAERRAVERSLALAAQRAALDALAQDVDQRTWQQWFADGELGISALREPGGDWGLGPRLGLELPLLDGGGARTQRAAALLRSGLHDEVQLAVEIRSAARTLRARAEQLAARARFLRDEHLVAREAALRGTVQQYNAMQVGAFDVLRHRQLQLAEQREQVELLRRAHLARLDVQQLFAGSLPPGTFTAPAATGHGSGSATTTPAERGHE